VYSALYVQYYRFVCVEILSKAVLHGILELSWFLYAVFECSDITLIRQKINYKNIYAITKRLRGHWSLKYFVVRRCLSELLLDYS